MRRATTQSTLNREAGVAKKVWVVRGCLHAKPWYKPPKLHKGVVKTDTTATDPFSFIHFDIIHSRITATQLKSKIHVCLWVRVCVCVYVING